MEDAVHVVSGTLLFGEQRAVTGAGLQKYLKTQLSEKEGPK